MSNVWFDPRGWGGGRWRSYITGQFVKPPAGLRVPVTKEQQQVASDLYDVMIKGRGLAIDALKTIDAEVGYLVKKIIEAQVAAHGLETETRVVYEKIVNSLDAAVRIAQAVRPIPKPQETQFQISDMFIGSALWTALGNMEGSALGETTARTLSILASRLNKQILDKGTTDALTFILADALVRTGKFISDASSAGYLVAFPSAIVFDVSKTAAVGGVLEAMSDDEFARSIIMSAVSEEKGRIVDEWVRKLRLGLSAMNIQAIGGSYSAPITNTGALANAIGEITGSQHPHIKKSADKDTIAVIGIAKPGKATRTQQSPGLYGEVLAHARSSAPPSASLGGDNVGLRRFFGIAKPRFRAWGASRGIPNEHIDRIMVKVFRRGTYGRAWMAAIANGISPPNMMFIGDRIADEIQRLVDEVGLHA